MPRAQCSSPSPASLLSRRAPVLLRKLQVHHVRMATGESPVEKAARSSCSAGCLSWCAQPIQPKASAVQHESSQTPEPLSCFPLRMTKPLTGGEGSHGHPSCSINLYPVRFPALRMSRALLCAARRVGSAPALATCVHEAGRASRAPPAAPHPRPAPLPPAMAGRPPEDLPHTQSISSTPPGSCPRPAGDVLLQSGAAAGTGALQSSRAAGPRASPAEPPCSGLPAAMQLPDGPCVPQ